MNIQQKKNEVLVLIKNILQFKMNNNNLRSSPAQWGAQNERNYSAQTASNTSQAQYNYQIHQPIGSLNRQELNEQQVSQGYKPYDMSFKQKNKGMYNSSMNFTNNNSNLSGLSSFGRQVNQPVSPNDKNDSGKTLEINSNDKYSNVYNKYTAHGTRDTKLASSAIFPTNNSNQEDFNKFPSFAIGSTQNSQQSSASSYTTAQPTKFKANETAQEKKQRELMQIKRQLDELNKKMVFHSDKNKNQNQSSNNQFRPKPTGVSQSVIIQSHSVPNLNMGFGNNGAIHSNKPPSGFQNVSIQQLYAQKKGVQTIKSPKPVQQFYEPIKSEQTTYTQNKTNNNYLNTPTQLPYQYKPQNNYSNYKMPQFTPQQPQQSYTNYNAEIPNFADKTNIYQTKTGSAPNNYTDKYTVSSNNTSSSPPIEASSNYNFSKSSQASSSSTSSSQQTGFKKKKDPIIYEPMEVKKFDFKKNINIDQPISVMKKPTYDTATSTPKQQAPKNFGLKKIDSVNYQDSFSPVPQLKKFKITDFIIGKKMGKGQFGEVMLVRHKDTGFICGLKVMEKKQIREEDYVGQIARQLSIQFYLSHRNVAPLYGYFDDEKNVYLLVQFCTGGQLLEKLRGQRRMNQKDVSVIIKQVCEGIDYIHKQLIIHRDIKPENILFNFGIVKISDFGWAVYRGFGMRKTASGSPLYYPPEIVKGESYDDKIDIWNIGMMTYECILGKIPFRVYSQLDLGRIVSDQITFPSYVDVTDEAKDFILKTMKKKGQERMQIRQMLRHPFITKHQDSNISQSILEQFKRVLG